MWGEKCTRPLCTAVGIPHSCLCCEFWSRASSAAKGAGGQRISGALARGPARGRQLQHLALPLVEMAPDVATSAKQRTARKKPARSNSPAKSARPKTARSKAKKATSITAAPRRQPGLDVGIQCVRPFIIPSLYVGGGAANDSSAVGSTSAQCVELPRSNYFMVTHSPAQAAAQGLLATMSAAATVVTAAAAEPESFDDLELENEVLRAELEQLRMALGAPDARLMPAREMRDVAVQCAIPWRSHELLAWWRRPAHSNSSSSSVRTQHQQVEPSMQSANHTPLLE